MIYWLATTDRKQGLRHTGCHSIRSPNPPSSWFPLIKKSLPGLDLTQKNNKGYGILQTNCLRKNKWIVALARNSACHAIFAVEKEGQPSLIFARRPAAAQDALPKVPTCRGLRSPPEMFRFTFAMGYTLQRIYVYPFCGFPLRASNHQAAQVSECRQPCERAFRKEGGS